MTPEKFHVTRPLIEEILTKIGKTTQDPVSIMEILITCVCVTAIMGNFRIDILSHAIHNELKARVPEGSKKRIWN